MVSLWLKVCHFLSHNESHKRHTISVLNSVFGSTSPAFIKLIEVIWISDFHTIPHEYKYRENSDTYIVYRLTELYARVPIF